MDIFESSNSHSRRNSNLQFLNSDSIIARVKGLKYVTNFISKEEHNELWQAINSEPWLTDIKRRVQHYGWKYDYKARSIDYSMFLGELPIWARPLAERLFQAGHLPKNPDQLIVNEYQPGQGIANHIDCEPCFGDTIISVSLGTSCIMDFIKLNTKEKVEIILEPMSLVVISGEARYNWTHGIAARKTDNFNGIKMDRELRISLTFRNIVLNSNKSLK